MKKLVKGLLFTLLLVLGVMAAGCGDNKAADVQKVRIGVSGAAEEVIWKPVIDKFKEKNVAIELVVFTDYTQPNAALANKEIELNAFQHHKYLNNEIKKHGYEITAIGNTMLSALNLYSKNIHDIKEIKPGDKIAVPNDTVNFGRALSVLQAAESEGFELIFFLSPYFVFDNERLIINGAKEYAGELGIPFLDYNTTEVLEEISLDPATDMMNDFHH